jgi:hypothetical protein
MILGHAEIKYRGGVVERIDYVAHGATAIGWTFQVEGDGLVIIHPASVESIRVTRYKLDIKPQGGIVV